MKFLWTTIDVRDLDESIQFYSRITGLTILRRFSPRPTMEIVFMGNGSDGETLIELIKDSTNPAINIGDSISIGFAVDSVDAMLAVVKQYNIPVHSGPFVTPASQFFTIKDPNGLNVQFFQQKK
jgi:lactoylglutathione lyase